MLRLSIIALLAIGHAKIARVDPNRQTEISLSPPATTRSIDLSNLPEVPFQFYGVLATEAHLLNKTEDYPPWRRRIELFYDFPNKLAKSNVLEGLEANKTFLRRWDTQDEYMYRQKGNFPVCRRAFLSEPMPEPELGRVRKEAIRQPGTVTVNGRTAVRWTREEYPSRQQIHVDVATGVVFSVTDEFFEEPGAADPPPMEYPNQDPASKVVPEPPSPTAGTWVPVMTYTFEQLVVGPPEAWPLTPQQREGLWEVPAPWSADNHTRCVRHQGGWPYLHVFHYFLRV